MRRVRFDKQLMMEIESLSLFLLVSVRMEQPHHQLLFIKELQMLFRAHRLMIYKRATRLISHPQRIDGLAMLFFYNHTAYQPKELWQTPIRGGVMDSFERDPCNIVVLHIVILYS